MEHEDITEIYQYAADMGGAGFIFTGDNDADIMHNSSLINLNLTKKFENYSKKLPKVFTQVQLVYIRKKFRNRRIILV